MPTLPLALPLGHLSLCIPVSPNDARGGDYGLLPISAAGLMKSLVPAPFPPPALWIESSICLNEPRKEIKDALWAKHGSSRVK